MWKKAQEQFKTRSLVATIVMMVVIVIASIIYVISVRSYMRTQSYSELKIASTEAIEAIEGQFRTERNMLRMIANIISSSNDSLHSLEVNTYLNIYDMNSQISDVAILNSNNKVIRINGLDLDSTGVLDFEDVKLKGEHISSLLKDLEKENVYDLRNFVPIRRNEETVAFLYGTTTPEDIVRAWVPEIYDGHAIVSVIERDTGLFLIDSSNRTGTTLENAGIRVSDISVSDTFENAILSGRSGYAIGHDTVSDKVMYFCFLPMNIANWEMVVSVPEEYVYAEVQPIQVSLFGFLTFGAIALIIYFLYVLRITTGSLIGIERRANMDALTGLQNRNRYEYFCQHLQQGTDGLACIYFDVNGLHDINNSQGHLAGDNMLKTIATIISEEYGESNTYRIGGDEFVAFRYDRDENTVRHDLDTVSEKVIAAGYHVAVGLAMATPDKKLLTVIKEAEAEMYEDKRKYYESIGKEMRG